MKISRSVCSALIAITLIISPVPAVGWWSPVYVIVDPVRDMNWDLKSIKKYMALAEEKLASLNKRLGRQVSSIYNMMMAQRNASASITSFTTAMSKTNNPASEERYTPTATEVLCSVIAVNRNNGTSCVQLAKQRTHEARRLEQIFLDGTKADSEYYVSIFASAGITEPTSSTEKEIIKTIGADIDMYARAITRYQLIDVAHESTITSINDLLFDWELDLPSPKQLVRNPEHFSTQHFHDYFYDQTAKGFVEKNIRDRLQGSSRYANDAPLIQAASDEYTKELLTQLTGNISSAESTRLWAVIQARQLQNDYKKLEVSMMNESAMALRVKKVAK